MGWHIKGVHDGKATDNTVPCNMDMKSFRQLTTWTCMKLKPLASNTKYYDSHSV